MISKIIKGAILRCIDSNLIIRREPFTRLAEFRNSRPSWGCELVDEVNAERGANCGSPRSRSIFLWMEANLDCLGPAGLALPLRTGRKPLGVRPELPNRQFEVAADRCHHINGYVRRTALNLSQVIGAVAKIRRQRDLRNLSLHAHLCDGTSKHLTRSLRSAALVSSDRFAHPVMVARDGGFIITTIVVYIPKRQL